jgi:putative ABC transport system permease protein
MYQLLSDLRFGLRMLVKNPGFAAVAIITLALGIGANTAMFSVVDGVLLRQLPYKDSPRLAVVGLSMADYQDLRQSTTAFDRTAVWASNLYNVKSGDTAEQIGGVLATSDFFPMLGEPLLGHTFSNTEANDPVLVLSYALWQSRFAGSPQVLGQSMELNGKAFTIIGVMPREFSFPSSDYKFWVPLEGAMRETPEQLNNRSLRIFRMVGRLAPGVSLTQAQGQLDALSKRLQAEYPATNSGVQFRAQAVREWLLGAIRPALLVLLGTVGFVLLISCANVANLLLARTTARERELAVRTALGATAGRLFRQLLTESTVLSVAGGALGLFVAFAGLALLRVLNVGVLPRMETIELDAPVLLFTLAVSLLTGAIFGAGPALQATHWNVNEALKEGGRGGSSSRTAGRLRAALVSGEVALAMVVLVSAGLLLNSFERLLHVEAGFDAKNLLTMTVVLTKTSGEQRTQKLDQALTAIQQLPGVETAAAATGLPPITP